jgi:hypothetical protein
MSKTCGDTARFFRMRKQRNIRRARARDLRAEIAAGKVRPGSAAERPKQ